jgi:hypothetical protein
MIRRSSSILERIKVCELYSFGDWGLAQGFFTGKASILATVLWAGQPRNRESISGRGKIFLNSLLAIGITFESISGRGKIFLNSLLAIGITLGSIS